MHTPVRDIPVSDCFELSDAANKENLHRPSAPVPKSNNSWKGEDNVKQNSSADDTLHPFENLAVDLNPTLNETHLGEMEHPYGNFNSDLVMPSNLRHAGDAYRGESFGSSSSSYGIGGPTVTSRSSGSGIRRLQHSISHNSLHDHKSHTYNIHSNNEFRPIKSTLDAGNSYLPAKYSFSSRVGLTDGYTSNRNLTNDSSSSYTHPAKDYSLSHSNTGYSHLKDNYYGSSGAGPPLVSSSNDNLDMWQRKHQEQLRQQQIEIAQKNFSKPDADPDTIQQVADRIIEGKDAIIEKLNSQIEELMERTPDHKHIQRKLGKVEYEFEEYKLSMEKKMARLQFEIDELTGKLKKQTTESLMWHSKYGELQDRNLEQREKIVSMERYMADLPTMESRQEHTKQVSHLQEDVSRYKQRLLEQDRKLTDSRKSVKRNEELNKVANQENELLKKKILLCEKEIDKWKSMCEDKGPTQEMMDDCKAGNDILKKQLDNAKKLIDSMQKQKHELENRRTTAETELQKRLAQEESTIEALRQESNLKDKHLAKLRSSVKELGAENQELMTQRLTLQEQIHDLETLQTGDMYRMQKRLYKELDVCFSSLQSLVQACLQQTEGQNPNISLLLGAQSFHTTSATDDDKMNNSQGLKHRLSQAKELRKDIDELRQRISDKVADDLTANATCAQQ